MGYYFLKWATKYSFPRAKFGLRRWRSWIIFILLPYRMSSTWTKLWKHFLVCQPWMPPWSSAPAKAGKRSRGEVGVVNPQLGASWAAGCTLTRPCSGSDLITGNYKDYSRDLRHRAGDKDGQKRGSVFLLKKNNNSNLWIWHLECHIVPPWD